MLTRPLRLAVYITRLLPVLLLIFLLFLVIFLIISKHLVELIDHFLEERHAFESITFFFASL